MAFEIYKKGIKTYTPDPTGDAGKAINDNFKVIADILENDGVSGYSGFSGYSGSSGFSGYSGPGGTSGFSGYSGPGGASGFSGYSGTSGAPGGTSGFSGYSGKSGYSGYSGRSILNVKSYGAVGDNSTDDTRAIQAAITASNPNATWGGLTGWTSSVPDNGAMIYFPAGIYKTSAPIKLYGGVRLFGDGTANTHIIADFTPKSITISRSSNTATVTMVSGKHGYQTGDIVTIAGATQTDYNGNFTVTVTSDTQFTYTVANSPATPATGSPTVQVVYPTTRGAIEYQEVTQGYNVSCFVENFHIFNATGHGICNVQQNPNLWRAEEVLRDTTGSGSFTSYSSTNKFFNTGYFTALANDSEYLYIGHSTTFAGIDCYLKQQSRSQSQSVTTIPAVYPNGYRQEYTWQYWNGSTWTTLSLSYDLSAGFDAMYNTSMAWSVPGDWATTAVNSITRYWIRIKVKTGNPVAQPPIFYNIGVKGQNWQGIIRNVGFTGRGWGVLLPPTESYCQNSIFENVYTNTTDTGLLFITGNANYLKQLNSEGSGYTINNSAIDIKPAMITVFGAANAIRDCIAEGSYNKQNAFGPPGYYIRGANCIFDNNYFEGSFTDEDGTGTVFEQAQQLVAHRSGGGLKLIDSPGVSVDTDSFGSIADRSPVMLGTSSVKLGNMYTYYDYGGLGDPKRWYESVYSIHADSVVRNIDNPLTGNLLFNGDFENGLQNWNVTLQGATPLSFSTSPTVEAKPDGSGKRLKFAVTGGTASDQRTFIETRLKVPTSLEGSPGYIGWTIDCIGNAQPIPYIQQNAGAGRSTGLTRAFGSGNGGRTAFRVNNLQDIVSGSDNTILLWFGTGSDDLSYVYQNNGSGTYTDKTAASTQSTTSPWTMFPSTSYYVYLGGYGTSPVEFTFTFQTPGTGCTVVVEFWDGSTWRTGTITSDTTNNFSQNGTLKWSPGNYKWVGSTIAGNVPTRWTRIKLSAMSTSPVLSYIKLPRTFTAYFSDAYVVAGEMHNFVPETSAQKRFSNGNVLVRSSDVWKYSSGWTNYVTSSQYPNVGTWKVGDQVLLDAPKGSIGWLCTTAGTDTASAWKRFGSVGGLNYIDARDYGVTADGSTDDTTALQNAINAACANEGTLMLPKGKIKITSKIYIGRTVDTPPNPYAVVNLTIRGVGSSGLPIGGEGGWLNYISETAIVWAGSAGGTMFETARCLRLRFEKVHLSGHATYNSANRAGKIIHCTMADTGWPSSGLRLDNCFLSNYDIGIQMGTNLNDTNCDEVIINDTGFQSDYARAFVVKNYQGLVFRFLDVWLAGNNTMGVDLEAGGDILWIFGGGTLSGESTVLRSTGGGVNAGTINLQAFRYERRNGYPILVDTLSEYTTTSSTANTIAGSGTKTFTVANKLHYRLGQTVVATSASGSMTGTVSAYTQSTGSLSIAVTSSTGSGSGLTDWTLSFSTLGNGGTNIYISSISDSASGATFTETNTRGMFLIGDRTKITCYNSVFQYSPIATVKGSASAKASIKLKDCVLGHNPASAIVLSNSYAFYEVEGCGQNYWYDRGAFNGSSKTFARPPGIRWLFMDSDGATTVYDDQEALPLYFSSGLTSASDTTLGRGTRINAIYANTDETTASPNPSGVDYLLYEWNYPFTIAFHLKVYSGVSNNAMILQLGSRNHPDQTYLSIYNNYSGGGIESVRITYGSASYTLTATGASTSPKFVTVVAESSTSAKVYLDGVLQSTLTATAGTTEPYIQRATFTSSGTSADNSFELVYDADTYVTDTSSSNVVIGTGDKTFTVSASKNYTVGQSISVFNGSNGMHGYIKSYSGTTLVIRVPTTSGTWTVGSGTYSSWNIATTAINKKTISGATCTAGVATNGREYISITDGTSVSIWDRANAGFNTWHGGTGYPNWYIGADVSEYTVNNVYENFGTNVVLSRIDSGSMLVLGKHSGQSGTYNNANFDIWDLRFYKKALTAREILFMKDVKGSHVL